MVVTTKKTSWGGSNKFEDIDFENTNTFDVPNVHSMIVDGKKVFLKKLYLIFIRVTPSTFFVA